MALQMRRPQSSLFNPFPANVENIVSSKLCYKGQMGLNTAFKGLTYYCAFCVIHIWNCLIRLVTAWLTEELGFVPCRGRIHFISFTNSDPTRLVPSRVTVPFMGGKAVHAVVHFLLTFQLIFIVVIYSVHESSSIMGMWLKTKQTTAKNSCDYFEKK